MKTKPFRTSVSAALLLNAFAPGLGHFIWGEVLFALFVFLVMLIAVMLFVVSLLVPLPLPVKYLLFGLPLLFYAFTFLDVTRTVRSKSAKRLVTTRRFILAFAAGLLYQLLSPTAPANFGLNNLPELFIQPDNHFSPVFAKGEILKASPLSYFVNLTILDRPVVHELPVRYDIVRFRDSTGHRLTGIVLGLPGEDVESVEGVVVINGYPDTENGLPSLALRGDWPLTRVSDYSILVASVNLGVIQNVYQVPIRQVLGKVKKLL